MDIVRIIGVKKQMACHLGFFFSEDLKPILSERFWSQQKKWSKTFFKRCMRLLLIESFVQVDDPFQSGCVTKSTREKLGISHPEDKIRHG